jgi:hypothetical protein
MRIGIMLRQSVALGQDHVIDGNGIFVQNTFNDFAFCQGKGV